MPDGSEATTVKVLSRIADISAEEWDSCAGGDHPFTRHAFLHALEASGSACPESGWAPQHLVALDDKGKALAVAPLYLKSHSYGEYVFDWGWAEAYHRAGGRYYPKLQCAVPFTPATGSRLMLRPDAPPSTRQVLIAAMLELAKRSRASSLHITFPTEEECRLMGEAGLMTRIGQQYHWENRGYGSFDDFLGELSSRKRKAIRKEREQANSHGVDIRILSGQEIEERHWDAFYRFYLSTIDRKWAHAYLTKDFFHLLGRNMGDAVVLVVAERHGNPIAGALNLKSSDTLYGRNWGASEDLPFLHFEACYYRAIDYAIAHGLKRVEAGAQGAHKVQRGYLPNPTWSAHWIADPGLRAAVARFLEQEREMIAMDMEETAEAGPYRRQG
nr:GNAT family N-acetyltransferase [Telmatospirillum sp. J64-1]